jgi:hypothetical protein
VVTFKLFEPEHETDEFDDTKEVGREAWLGDESFDALALLVGYAITAMMMIC